MTCDDRRDMIMLYAADALDAAERDELRGHLATGCPACAGVLAEAEAVLARLPVGLPGLVPPAAARDRLMTRVMGEPGKNSKFEISKGGSRWRLPVAAGVAAAVAALVTAGMLRMSRAPEKRLLESPGMQFVSLGGGDPQPNAKGRIFWDRERNDWHMYVFDLVPPPPGKTYELWFITTDPKRAPVRAGTFDVDASGRGSLVVRVPAGIGPLAAAAVTRENAGGSDTPTMPIQLVGKIQ